MAASPCNLLHFHTVGELDGKCDFLGSQACIAAKKRPLPRVGAGRSAGSLQLNCALHSLPPGATEFRAGRRPWPRNRRTSVSCRADQKEPGSGEPHREGDGNDEKPAAAQSSDEKGEKDASAEQQQSQASGQAEGQSGGPLGGITVTPIWKRDALSTATLPKADIDVLRNQVFGFDTYFVTQQEPYEGGVLFKGNLRGDSAKAFGKLNVRLKEKFQDQYKLFLIEDPADERPAAVVLPAASLVPPPSALPEWVAASAFGLTTFFTLLLRNTEAPEFYLLPSLEYLTGPLLEGLPGALVMAAVLGAHELGHLAAAKRAGLSLSIPYFIPSWQLGSFGAITRIKGIVRDRQQLLEIGVAGPLAGSLLALGIIVVGLLLPPGDSAVVVQSSVFHDSILIGGLAKLIFGGSLQEGSSLLVSPLVLAAWAGLLINALNCIPVGELDGGRIALALWGRKVAARFSLASLLLLGLGGIFNDVALYWAVLVAFIQRGPILPQEDGLTPPNSQEVAIGAATLVFALLVYAPLPIPFS